MELYVYKDQKKLRCGFTTGTAAAAAAAAAAWRLLMGQNLSTVTVKTPKGIAVSVPVTYKNTDGYQIICGVIKDGGDDPDMTNGLEICASVSKASAHGEIRVTGGVGVGVVTGPGLYQKPGEAAINPVPMQMITDAVQEVCSQGEYSGGMEIVISVPEGEAVAAKTFNPKLGIKGGISILGTSGIVEPMSERALIDTIQKELMVYRQQSDRLLVVPGNYGKDFVRETLKLDIPLIKCSNYIGDMLDMAALLDYKSVLIVGDFGKLVKTAAGIMNTHSKTADGRMEIIGVHAAVCGALPQTVSDILKASTTEAALDILSACGILEAVMLRITNSIHDKINGRTYGKVQTGAVVFSRQRGELGKTVYADEILRRFQNECR